MKASAACVSILSPGTREEGPCLPAGSGLFPCQRGAEEDEGLGGDRTLLICLAVILFTCPNAFYGAAIKPTH